MSVHHTCHNQSNPPHEHLQGGQDRTRRESWRIGAFVVYLGMNRIVGILFVLLLVGCADAPHDNPLDPLSPSYATNTALSGSVVLKNLLSAVSSAQIRTVEDGIAAISDSAGRFSFQRLSLGTHTLICTKENFAPDTQRVTMTSGGSLSVTFVLNGAPTVISKSILTRKVDQYYPSPQYYVDVTANVTDPNGVTDLDSVYFHVDSLMFPMDYVVSTKLFQARIFKYDLPTNTIQWLVGKPLYIISKDRAKAVNTSEMFLVTRVIEYGATPLYPSSINNDTTSGTPVLKWTPPSVTFNYTYTLSISRDDGGTQTVVWTLPNVSSFFEQYSYPTDGSVQSLSAGNYVWAVTIVDEFGNSCRSKESFFVVR